MRASGHDDSFNEVFSKVLTQPVQVSYVPVVDDRVELDLDCDDSSIRGMQDQIHLMFPTVGAQVRDLESERLREDTQAQGDQRFEECADQRATAKTRKRLRVAVQQIASVRPKKRENQKG